jgi:drug/metabolite transporter (DMT)-like permease
LQASDNRRGIIAMVTSMTLFSVSDTLVKLAAAALPAGQIMAVRGAFAILFLLVLVAARGEASRFGALRSPLVLVRGLLEAVIAFLFITSLAQLPLANINAILQATPLILTLLTVLLGIETVGWRRWSAIIVGFVGVLFIVKPTLSGMNVYALFAFASAALVAVRDLVTRRIRGDVPTSVITLATTLAVTAAGILLSAGDVWSVPSGPQLMLLAGAALFVTLGSLAVVTAFRVGEMAVVSPFRYSVILSSLVLGYLVFGEWPDAYAFLGIALIVGSGLYTLHREQVRHLSRRPAAAAAMGEVP